MVQDNSSTPDSDAHLSPTENDRQTSVLLAEDDRALRRFLEVVLERAGYRVFPASDGLEAMKLVLAAPIDVVVTDAIMPNLSGNELCRFLRNSPALSHLPIILLSALERKGRNPGAEQADAFLSKPVSGEKLIEVIEKLLAGKKE
jgi:twitching motility two-component system response regulator PilH